MAELGLKHREIISKSCALTMSMEVRNSSNCLNPCLFNPTLPPCSLIRTLLLQIILQAAIYWMLGTMLVASCGCVFASPCVLLRQVETEAQRDRVIFLRSHCSLWLWGHFLSDWLIHYLYEAIPGGWPVGWTVVQATLCRETTHEACLVDLAWWRP